MIFQFFCSLFVVTRYDVDRCLNLGPSKIGYHVHLVDHSTRVAVLLFAVLHRADESQPARNSCPRLPHSVDSRFGLYHVDVVLSFLRSPSLQKFELLGENRTQFSAVLEKTKMAAVKKKPNDVIA